MLREVKMTGGGRSHVRTLLRLKYPANREKYREFCESSRLFPIVRGCNRLVVYNFCSNSQLEPLNRTGNYQGIEFPVVGNQTKVSPVLHFKRVLLKIRISRSGPLQPSFGGEIVILV